MINKSKCKKMTYLIASIIFVLILLYSCLVMNKFTKGVIEDAKRMDTIQYPEVFSIDSIKNNVKTKQLE